MPMRPLTENELEMITKATLISTAEKGLENARKNKHLVKKSILDIQDKHEEKGALLISAGPSLKRIDPAVIKDSGFKGSIVSVDASLPFCLKNGIIPDCVVSVDEDPVRIIRWYGDPEFENRKYDDYFTKKYGGSKTFEDEVRANKEYIELVNKHAPKIKAIIATSVDNNVAKRCTEAGFDTYWWNPMYDDYEKENSFTRQAYQIVKVPALMTGGNVGASAWVFAHTILEKIVGMIGMDFGYVVDSSMKAREMGSQMKEIFGDKAQEAFIEVFNPYTKEMWHTDPTFYWYRECFLKMIKELNAKVYNCSKGGIVFGENVINISLEEFLEKF